MSQEQPSSSGREERSRNRVELYAEETFKGANLTRLVHIGWGAMGGEPGLRSADGGGVGGAGAALSGGVRG